MGVHRRFTLRGIFLDRAPADLLISPQMVNLSFGLSQGLLQLNFEYTSLCHANRHLLICRGDGKGDESKGAI